MTRIAENPFYVLGLRTDCTRMEMEREGQKLLGMLELGLSDAMFYASPLGYRHRTADEVRRAMAELRDPDKRLVHELWARLDPLDGEQTAEKPGSNVDPAAPWPEAMWALGWR